MKKCAWCKLELKSITYPSVKDFILSFTEGTTSEDTGPNLTGYEVEELCIECAYRLKDELIKLGIEVKDLDI